MASTRLCLGSTAIQCTSIIECGYSRSCYVAVYQRVSRTAVTSSTCWQLPRHLCHWLVSFIIKVCAKYDWQNTGRWSGAGVLLITFERTEQWHCAVICSTCSLTTAQAGMRSVAGGRVVTSPGTMVVAVHAVEGVYIQGKFTNLKLPFTFSSINVYYRYLLG